MTPTEYFTDSDEEDEELLKAKEAELESKNKFINQIAVSENS